jgi:sec-independent protein translocase protein TatA
MFGGKIGLTEILIVLLVLVIFFGAKRIPEIARALGKSLNEFKKGREEEPSSESAEESKDSHSPKPS